MHERYLGDSYDIVKRFFGEQLCPIAPMRAHPRFIPDDLHDAFTRLTTIPVWDEKTDEKMSLLLDPHTGIPLPDAANQGVRISHAPIQFIADLLKMPNLSFVVCFDQTRDRQHELSIADQPDAKREALRDLGVFSFYYMSHAPFLFASKTSDTLVFVRNRLIELGVPEITTNGTRLQSINIAG